MNVQFSMRLSILFLLMCIGSGGELPAQSTSSSAYERYAEGLLKNYDQDEDGYLDAEEMGQMRRPPENADTDNDGKVSKAELLDSTRQIFAKRKSGKSGRLGNKPSGKSAGSLLGTTSGQKMSSSAYERYAEGLFKNYDQDEDGYLDAEEMGQMRRPPENADTDNDGKISKAELLDSARQKSGKRKAEKPGRSVGKSLGSLLGVKASRKSDNPEFYDALLKASQKTDASELYDVQFHLFQFSDDAGEDVTSLIAQLDVANDDPKGLMAPFIDHEKLVDSARFQIGMLKDGRMELEFGMQNDSQRIAFDAHLKATSPKIQCQIKLESLSQGAVTESAKMVSSKPFIRVSGLDGEKGGKERLEKMILDKINQGLDVRGGGVEDDKGEKERLEKMILDKINERRKRVTQKSPVGRATKKSKAVNLRLNTTLVCEPETFHTAQVIHDGRLWLLIARFDPDQ